MNDIRIFDKGFNLLGETKCNEICIIRRFYRAGEFELKINVNRIYSGELIKNNIILFGKAYNKAGIILHREFVYNESGEKTDLLTVKGYLLQGLVARRIILPNPGTEYMSFEGNQESIIKGFINKNCIDTDEVRKIENLALAVNLNRGVQDKWRGAYENLNDKLQEICKFCELGWNISLDIKNKKFVFDVLEGRDLTVNQSIRAPIIFRSDFNNIRTRHYTESIINSKNSVYVGNKESMVLNFGDVKGFDRIETFIESDETDVQEITKEGKINLKDLEEIKTFELEVSPTKTFAYEKDYDLGDKVTVQDRKLKVTMNPRIIEIKENYNENGMNLKITFGKSLPTLLTKIKRLVK